jgi:hypothetical protein
MPNDTKKSGQLSFYDLIQKQQTIPHKEGSLDIHTQFRNTLSLSIRRSNLSRYQICAIMSELLGQDITVNMLNGWTAESKDEHRFPAEFLPAFCEAVGSYEPMKFLAQKAGLFLLPSAEALRSEIQRLCDEKEQIENEIKKRKFFLDEINE